MTRKGGPAPVHDIAVTVDGVTHMGTYYVQDSLVYVQCGAGKKATQVGGSSASSIARLLMLELVRERRE